DANEMRLIFKTVLGLVLLSLGLALLLYKKPAAPPRVMPAATTAPVDSTTPIPTEPTSQPLVPPDAYVPPTSPAPSAPPAIVAGVAPAHLGFVADGRLLVVDADGRAEYRDVATGQRRPVGVSL